MAYAIIRGINGEVDSKEIIFVVDDADVSNVLHELRKETEKAYHHSDRILYSKEYVAIYESSSEAMTEINHYI